MKKSEVDKMTVKEAVDYSMNKLIEQGSRCILICGGNEECVYGNEHGNHCVVGWLLNENNKKLMDAEGVVGELIEDYPHAVPKLIINNDTFFELLQHFHDLDTVHNRKKALSRLKERFPEFVDLRKGYWRKWINMATRVI